MYFISIDIDIRRPPHVIRSHSFCHPAPLRRHRISSDWTFFFLSHRCRECQLLRLWLERCFLCHCSMHIEFVVGVRQWSMRDISKYWKIDKLYLRYGWWREAQKGVRQKNDSHIFSQQGEEKRSRRQHSTLMAHFFTASGSVNVLLYMNDRYKRAVSDRVGINISARTLCNKTNALRLLLATRNIFMDLYCVRMRTTEDILLILTDLPKISRK